MSVDIRAQVANLTPTASLYAGTTLSGQLFILCALANAEARANFIGTLANFFETQSYPLGSTDWGVDNAMSEVSFEHRFVKQALRAAQEAASGHMADCTVIYIDESHGGAAAVIAHVGHGCVGLVRQGTFQHISKRDKISGKRADSVNVAELLDLDTDDAFVLSVGAFLKGKRASVKVQTVTECLSQSSNSLLPTDVPVLLLGVGQVSRAYEQFIAEATSTQAPEVRRFPDFGQTPI
jgi:hypothetical protein